MSMIDLSTLAPPDVVENLDFEAVLDSLKAELIARLPSVEGVLGLESEPLVKLLQVAAYREVLLRQRVNEAARSVMVAYAVGTDLDHMGANYGITRLPGETDARLRHRVQQAYNRLAAAGPADAYRQHALGVSAQIIDVDVFSEAPGRVTVSVLAPHDVRVEDASPLQRNVGSVLFGAHKQQDRAYIVQPSEGTILRAVLDVLNADHVRPLTDHVVVRAPRILPYSIDATIEVLPGPDPALVLSRRKAALRSYVVACQTHRVDVTRAGITSALFEGAVKDVRLLWPQENIVSGPGDLAVCTSLEVSAEAINA